MAAEMAVKISVFTTIYLVKKTNRPILMISGSFCMVSDMLESLNIAPSPPKVNFKVISTGQIYFSSFNALNKVLVF